MRACLRRYRSHKKLHWNQLRAKVSRNNIPVAFIRVSYTYRMTYYEPTQSSRMCARKYVLNTHRNIADKYGSRKGFAQMLHCRSRVAKRSAALRRDDSRMVYTLTTDCDTKAQRLHVALPIGCARQPEDLNFVASSRKNRRTIRLYRENPLGN